MKKHIHDRCDFGRVDATQSTILERSNIEVAAGPIITRIPIAAGTLE
jgi:hypothetical protein